MSRESVDVFISEVKASLKKHFKNYRIQILFKTPKSFKANIFLDQSLFIALRYNARNERTDFALIHNNQRIFGYDNLKKWHCHPFGKESKHIPCDRPSIDKIMADMKAVCENIKEKKL